MIQLNIIIKVFSISQKKNQDDVDTTSFGLLRNCTVAT